MSLLTHVEVGKDQERVQVEVEYDYSRGTGFNRAAEITNLVVKNAHTGEDLTEALYEDDRAFLFEQIHEHEEQTS